VTRKLIWGPVVLTRRKEGKMSRKKEVILRNNKMGELWSITGLDISVYW
jgi:hypothetical protein